MIHIIIIMIYIIGVFVTLYSLGNLNPDIGDMTVICTLWPIFLIIAIIIKIVEIILKIKRKGE